MPQRPFARVVLAGPHARLEPLDATHREGLRAAADCDRSTFVYAAVPRPDDDDLDVYLADAEQQHAAGAGLVFATIDGVSGEVVGSTRFMNAEYWTTPDRRPRHAVPPDAVEIGGTWLTPAAQRTGINTDAKLLVLAHAFDNRSSARVTDCETLATDTVEVSLATDCTEQYGVANDDVLRAETTEVIPAT